MNNFLVKYLEGTTVKTKVITADWWEVSEAGNLRVVKEQKPYAKVVSFNAPYWISIE